jgi:hypothetical protein
MSGEEVVFSRPLLPLLEDETGLNFLNPLLVVGVPFLFAWPLSESDGLFAVVIDSHEEVPVVDFELFRMVVSLSSIWTRGGSK